MDDSLSPFCSSTASQPAIKQAFTRQSLESKQKADQKQLFMLKWSFDFHLSSHLNFLVCLSDFYQLNLLEKSSLFALSHVSYFPIVDSAFRKFFHEGIFLVFADGYKKSPACLCCVAFHKPEILNFVFYFYQMFVDRELSQHEIDVILLSLCQVVGVTENSKSSDICTGMSFIFGEQSGSNKTESSHLILCSVESLNEVGLVGFLQNFITLFFVCFEPLHRIDGEPCSKGFSKDQRVSWLCVIWHNKVSFFYHSYGTASHHWPRIVDCLASSYLSLSLLCSFGEALDHQSCCDVFFELRHISRNSQNHKNISNVGDTHCVEI